MRSPSTADAVGIATGAAPVEHQVTDGVALDEHGVEAVTDRSQRVIDRAPSPGGHARRPRPAAVDSASSATASSLMARSRAGAANPMSVGVIAEMPSW